MQHRSEVSVPAAQGMELWALAVTAQALQGLPAVTSDLLQCREAAGRWGEGPELGRGAGGRAQGGVGAGGPPASWEGPSRLPGAGVLVLPPDRLRQGSYAVGGEG